MNQPPTISITDQAPAAIPEAEAPLNYVPLRVLADPPSVEVWGEPETSDPGPPPQLIRLEDAYEHAFTGITIDPTGPPRCVYSLTSLVRHLTFAHAVSPEEAQAATYAMVCDITRTHGPAAPVFVDDAVSVERRESVIVNPNAKPSIIVP